MWNEQLSETLETWYATPDGAFALSRKRELFRRLASGWPRRGRKLLQIGCGSGMFLGMLWEDGFDVTGFDSSPELLRSAAKRLDNRAEFRLGQPDHLPFDDDEFDYAVIPTAFEFLPAPEAALAEALRVAARGVVAMFVNRFSLFRLRGKSNEPPFYLRKGLSPWAVYAMSKRLCPSGRLTLRTIIPCPVCLWKEAQLLRRVNSLPLILPVGAFAGICIDKKPGIPMTPLWLTTRKLKPQEEPCGTAMQSLQHGQSSSFR